VIRSVLIGGLVLAGVQVLVSNPRAYGAAGQLGTSAAQLVSAWLSPSVALIPDRRKGQS
jgi:hypothetical protein